MMKAATRSKYGSPEVLSIAERAIPPIGDEELMIKNYAATVNRTDCGILFGKPLIIRFFTGLGKPRISVTGTDFAGVVEAAGSKVSNFKIGERVCGFNDNGLQSHAEYLTINQHGPLITIPDKISYNEAAASIEGAHYAYNFIKKVDLKFGDKVLLNGATGAIGSAAVQLLKYFGAHVTAVANTKNVELVKSLGADRVIDYLKNDFAEEGEKYQFVFDAVGKSSFSKCKSMLLEGGRYISSDLGPGNENVYLPITTLFADKKVIVPIPLDVKGSLRFIKSLLEIDKFRPVIDRVYPLEKITEAFTYVASGQKTGNVIINFNHS